MTATPNLTIEARRVLLDALDALHAHRASLILVGAQAVYLRTAEITLSFSASYTTDGDLVIDPRHLAGDPHLDTVMRAAAFEPVYQARPGIWGKQIPIGDHTDTVTIDLIVPEAVSGPGTRGARLGPHGNRAAGRAVGLEAALIDHGPLVITALDPTDTRRVTINVAGPAALLVAKLHKLHDRVTDQSRRPDRVRGKDAADIYRLMQNLTPATATATLQQLLTTNPAREATSDALTYLHELFATPRSPGTQLAIDALRGDIPNERVTAICTTFTRTTLAAINDPQR